jgi:hypothetical protein
MLVLASKTTADATKLEGARRPYLAACAGAQSSDNVKGERLSRSMRANAKVRVIHLTHAGTRPCVRALGLSRDQAQIGTFEFGILKSCTSVLHRRRRV